MIGHYWCEPCGVKVAEGEIFIPAMNYRKMSMALADGLGCHEMLVEVRPGVKKSVRCSGPILWKGIINIT